MNSFALSPWIQAVRLKTLTASIGPLAVGWGIVVQENVSLNPVVALLTLICTLLLQIGANLVNDYYDFFKNIDGENRLGPLRAASSGLIPPQNIKKAFILCFVLAFCLGIVLSIISGGLTILIIGLASIAFAYLYTGGPFPLSYYALGEVSALLFFGPVAVWGSAFLHSNTFFWHRWDLALSPGFMAAGLMAVNNLRDRKSDALGGKTTLAVLLGECAARYLVIFFILLGALIPLYSYRWTLLLALLSPLIFIKTWRDILTAPIDKGLNNSLACVGQFLLIYCLLLGIGLTL